MTNLFVVGKRHGMSRTSKELVVLSWGRLSCSSLVPMICCCFVWIERWYRTVSFGAVVVLVTTMNPFDDGLSRTVKILFTVVNSERSMARSSRLPKICCFVCSWSFVGKKSE